MRAETETLAQQIAGLADGTITPSFLAERSLARAQEFASLNAFVALDASHVRAQAAQADKRRRDGGALSAIDGIPIAVKDNYLTSDYPTTACSAALPLEPAGVDATIVANLRRGGAVIFGKTNMHEWAYGATNTTSRFGPTRNPHDQNRITGGSSGGSAAAVAAGIVAAALGSDTGGSVRIPSSACGIYGFKPSYGRASRHGVLPLSWSLDAPGPLTAGLDDIGHLLPFFCGVDARDPTTAHAAPFGATESVVKPKLIHLTGKGLERSGEVDASLRSALGRSGASVTEAGLPEVAACFAAWEAILHCEASAYHAPLLEKHAAGYTAVTRAHLEAGKFLSGADLLRAQQIRSRFVRDLLRLGDWDALVLPTLPAVAPRLGEDWQRFGGRRVTTQDAMTWFCWIGNLAGFPCLSMPIGASSDGLPIGMMLMGRPNADERLLAVARAMEAGFKADD